MHTYFWQCKWYIQISGAWAPALLLMQLFSNSTYTPRNIYIYICVCVCVYVCVCVCVFLHYTYMHVSKMLSYF